MALQSIGAAQSYDHVRYPLKQRASGPLVDQLVPHSSELLHMTDAGLPAAPEAVGDAAITSEHDLGQHGAVLDGERHSLGHVWRTGVQGVADQHRAPTPRTGQLLVRYLLKRSDVKGMVRQRNDRFKQRARHAEAAKSRSDSIPWPPVGWPLWSVSLQAA